MSGQTTAYFRLARMNETFLRAALPFSSVQIALTRKVPAANASVNQLDEFLQNNYARVAVNLGPAAWEVVNGTEVANKVAITFPRAGGTGWGTMHGWAMVAVGVDKVIAVGTLNAPLRCVGGIQPRLPAGSIIFGEHD